MGGIRTPIEIESNLSWNRLVRQTFQAIKVPESWGTRWAFQIPPVSYPANGFTYLIGVSSDSAPPSWRLGCSVRLASGAIPDSTGEFSSSGGLPLRIDDRRPCTLGSYTLCIWPDMEMADPHLIIEFPHWLQDATIEVFWYDGEYSGDFFSKLRESLMEIFGDEAYVDSSLGQYINSKIQQGIAGHSANENAHYQYLKKDEASGQYLRISDLDVAIADSDALRIALDAYLLKTEANAAFVRQETFDQERQFVDQAIQEAKDIAAADLAGHLAAVNPHGISPEAIGAATATHTHPVAPIVDILPVANGGTGASSTEIARINLGITKRNLEEIVFGADSGEDGPANFSVSGHDHIGTHSLINHSHFAGQIGGQIAIANGGTGASTAEMARINLGVAPGNHTHPATAVTTASYSFGTGWGVYGSPYTASITKYDKIVFLNGLVARNITTGKTITTLPSNFCPKSRKLFMCWGSVGVYYTPFRVDVAVNGVVTIEYPQPTTIIQWISLDGISFTT